MTRHPPARGRRARRPPDATAVQLGNPRCVTASEGGTAPGRAALYDRVRAVFDLLARELLEHPGIQLNEGKTRVWDRAGVRPHTWRIWDPKCGTRKG